MEFADCIKLLQDLDSNDPKTVEDAKRLFHETFNTVKDPWLLNNFFEYYLQSNSTKTVEVLVGVREPHDRFLFDKLADSLRGNNKLRALTLLGHVVRKQPAWLYKIAQHSLLKELLKLLKAETEILPMMSALLVLIVLLPMIPGYVGPYLQDIFEIFCRIASWNTLNPAKLVDGHLVHLQVGLYALFLRLYGMFPCNFLAFLRQQYAVQENLNIFRHTIKPMLDSVKMHPLLVTASKDTETMQDRWKNKGHHDVIVDCSKFALERIQQGPAGVTVAAHGGEGVVSSFMAGLRPLPALPPAQPSLELRANLISEERPVTIQHSPLPALTLQTDLWSPSLSFLATPPPGDLSMPHTPVNFSLGSQLHCKPEGSSPPEAAIEATPESTPVKDTRIPPRIPITANARRNLSMTGKPTSSSNSRGTSPTPSSPASPLKKEPAPFRFGVDRLMQERQKFASQPMEMTDMPSSKNDSISDSNSGSKNGASLDAGRMARNGSLEPHQHTGESSDQHIRSAAVDMTESAAHQARTEEDYDECQHALGSPCPSGGLHMPNKQSFLDFAQRVHRLRVHSVCSTFPALSAGASPSEGAAFPLQPKVRRAASCPDMKRGYLLSSSNSATSPLLDEKEEEEEEEHKNKVVVNGQGPTAKELKQCLSLGTQTSAEQWPTQPYEHLFLAVFPHSQLGEVTPDSLYCPQTLLDRYVEAAVTKHSNHQDAKKARTQELESEVKSLRGQLQLLHLQLQFERHRREAHAERNRRLAANARSNRALEEHNSALKEQLLLLQKAYEKLQHDLDSKRQRTAALEVAHKEELSFWQHKFEEQAAANRKLTTSSQQFQEQLGKQAEEMKTLAKELERCQSRLFNATSEVRHLQTSASDGVRVSTQVSHLQRQMVVTGEAQQRYRDQLVSLPFFSQRHEANAQLRDACIDELAGTKQQLEARTSSLEAAKARVAEMESMMIKKDALITEQKKLLRQMQDKYSAELEAAENKYCAVRAINQRQQEELLRLHHLAEKLESRTSGPLPVPQSPLGSGPRSPLYDSTSPLTEPLRPLVTTSTEMTNLHSLVDRDLPALSPPLRVKPDTSARDSALGHASTARKYD